MSDDSVIQQFASDNKEVLSTIDIDILALENQEANTDLLKLMKLLHNLKGTCGFFGFDKLVNITHMLESIIEQVNQRTLVVSPKLIDIIFILIDAIKEINEHILHYKKEPTKRYEDIIQQAQQILNQKKTVKNKGITYQKVTCHDSNDTNLIKAKFINEVTNYLREFIVIKNKLLNISKTENSNKKYEILIKKLDIVVNNFKKGLLNTRMQKLSVSWQLFHRYIIEKAKVLNKKIKLTIEGGHIELDKEIIDKLQNPLQHIISNCIDHGIETTEQRKAKKKPIIGNIVISAQHHMDNIYINISDDGKGIDIEKLKNLLITNKVIDKDKIITLSEAALLQYIFHPGISTKEEVSKTSGRGVGLNIVTDALQQLGGSVEVVSNIDKGTSFNIIIPKTLTVIKALILKVKQHKVALAKNTVVQIIKINKKNATNIIYSNDKAMLYYNNNMVPLLNIANILGLSKQIEFNGSFNIVICKILSSNFAIAIDDILGIEEVVTMNLPNIISNIDLYSAIVSSVDDALVLMLNSNRLLEYAKVHLQMIDHGLIEEKKQKFLYIDRKKSKNSINIALVEHGLLFKKFIALALEKSGFSVININDPKQIINSEFDIKAIVIDTALAHNLEKDLGHDFIKIKHIPMIGIYTNNNDCKLTKVTKKTNTTELIQMLSEMIQ